MESIKRCLEALPRKPGTAHSYIIEWLMEKLREV